MAPLCSETASDDEALVRRVQAGDTRAFEQLVIAYQDRVTNICYRLVGDHESAHDLAQETFLKAFDAIERFAHHSTFYTWLFRIAVNQSISYRRKAQRVKLHTLNVMGDSDGLSGGEHQARALQIMAGSRSERDNNPIDALQRQETRQAVASALEELEQDFRVILVLRDIEMMDYEAISSILDIPIGTVRSRLHRARSVLREKLRPVLDKAG